jgi:hypothetical protein
MSFIGVFPGAPYNSHDKSLKPTEIGIRLLQFLKLKYLLNKIKAMAQQERQLL